MALRNIVFLISDNELACEWILIGCPVLEHLRVETGTLLTNNRTSLNKMDSKVVGNPTGSKSIGYVIIVLNAIQNYFISETDTDGNSFTPDPLRPRGEYSALEWGWSISGSVAPRTGWFRAARRYSSCTESILQTTHGSALSAKDTTELGKTVNENVGIFRVALSSGQPTKVRHVKM